MTWAWSVVLLVCLIGCAGSYRWSERTTVRSQRTQQEAEEPAIKFVNKPIAEVTRNFMNVNPELTEIPSDIVQCYVNRTLWDAVQSVPFSMHTMASIVRRLETHPRARTWTAGRMAANLIHKYRFDGIHYDRCVDTSTGALPLRLDTQVEYPKMEMIWQLIQGDRNEVPDDALSSEEKCSLHWMLSYSVNRTMRYEELNYVKNSNPYLPVNSITLEENPDYVEEDFDSPVEAKVLPNSNDYDFWDRPFFYDCDRNTQESLSPIELGVAWARSGPVSTSNLIAGLAASLSPQGVPWLPGMAGHAWAATLAGDLAQTTLLRRKGETYMGPDGWYNSTFCPTRFMLRTQHQGGEEMTLSHMTVSEINGGIDGLLLAQHFRNGDDQVKLSQVLDTYYFGKGYKTSSDHLKVLLFIKVLLLF